MVTLSPTLNSVTSLPTSVMTPTFSWPRYVRLEPGMGSKAELVPVVALKKLISVPQRPQAIFFTLTQSPAGSGVSGRSFKYFTALRLPYSRPLAYLAANLVASILGMSLSKYTVFIYFPPNHQVSMPCSIAM